MLFASDTKMEDSAKWISEMKGGPEEKCQATMKALGTFLEVYSTDFKGRYPAALKGLTPRYGRQVLDCPTGQAYGYESESKPLKNGWYEGRWELSCPKHKFVYTSTAGFR